MAGQDADASIAKCSQPRGGSCLLRVVVAVHRKAMIVKATGEVRDVPSENEITADADRLMPGCVARREHQRDRSIAEQVVLAIGRRSRRRGTARLVTAIVGRTFMTSERTHVEIIALPGGT